MAKVKKTFRLEEEIYDELVKLSTKWNVSQGVAVERIVMDAVRNASSSQTSASEVGAVVKVLSDQLSAKDEQIAALNRALDAAHETAKAAQVLHAQERNALESAEQKSRWRRLREAWRG